MQRLNRIVTEIKNSSNITVQKQQKPIDLRSDTLTKPSLKMLQYGIQCQVGDDSYKEDPTVNKLQNLLKKIFNKDGAIFLPTTTMANTIAFKIANERIQSNNFFVNQNSHVYLTEKKGLNWTMPQLEWFNIFDELGYVKKQQIIKIIKQNKNSGIICLENPTFDGQIYGEQYLNIFKELKEQDTSKKLHFHLDGARIFDALTYYCKQKNFDIQNPHNLLDNNIQAIIKDKFQFFDSISICFSKGLCCPMGGYRKQIGGALRQSGYVAGMCLKSLEDILPNLNWPHQLVKASINILNYFRYIKYVDDKYQVTFPRIQSDINMVFFGIKDFPADKLAQIFKEKFNILLKPYKQNQYLRICFNVNSDEDELQYIWKSFDEILYNFNQSDSQIFLNS